MAPSATPSKMSKTETMHAEVARKIKEMEAALKQAEIEEELERQREEEEASKKRYEEAMREAMEAEKKQKTAYEMILGDWSSDVCSSDLRVRDRNIER